MGRRSTITREDLDALEEFMVKKCIVNGGEFCGTLKSIADEFGLANTTQVYRCIDLLTRRGTILKKTTLPKKGTVFAYAPYAACGNPGQPDKMLFDGMYDGEEPGDSSGGESAEGAERWLKSVKPVGRGNISPLQEAEGYAARIDRLMGDLRETMDKLLFEWKQLEFLRNELVKIGEDDDTIYYKRNLAHNRLESAGRHPGIAGGCEETR